MEASGSVPSLSLELDSLSLPPPLGLTIVSSPVLSFSASSHLPPIHYSSTSHPMHPLPLRPSTNPPLTTKVSDKLSYQVALCSKTSPSSTSASTIQPKNDPFKPKVLGRGAAGPSREARERSRSPAPRTRARRESERDEEERKRSWSRSRDTRGSVGSGNLIRASGSRDEQELLRI